MPDETRRACSVRIIASGESALEIECPACDRSGVTDRLMVKCDSCDNWYHSICVGVDESVMDRSFYCTQCLHRQSPTSSQVGKSSTTSAIQARVGLQMRRIEEEKQVQERLLREIEEQEKALREKSMQQELESKRKANQQRWELERHFIGKKYSLLQSVNDGDDDVSVRSLRSNRSSKSTVHRWLENQEEATMAAYAGNVEVPAVTTSYTGTIPKRTTARSITTSSNPTALFQTSISSRQAQVKFTDDNPLYDIAVGGVSAQVRGQSFEAIDASVPVSKVQTFPASVRNPIPAISDLISPPTSAQEELAKTFSKISSDAVTAHRKLEQQMLDLQKQMDALQRQSANQLRSQHDRGDLRSQSPAAPVSSLHGRVPWQGRSGQPLVSISADQLPAPRFSKPLFNLTPATISHNPQVRISSALETVNSSAPSSVPLPNPMVTTIPSYPNPIPSPWVPPSVPVVPPSVPVIPPSVPVIPPSVPVVPPNVPICGANAQQLAARHVVPKELPHFDGNPLDWPLFYSSYTNSTQMCGYTDAENLMRLQRCLKGNALSAVNYQLLHPSSVPQVMETLRTLFGRPELVVNSLLNKVRSTPAPRADKLESIISFGLVVQNLCGHLRSLGMENHLSNPTLLQELVSKLPAGVKLDWALHQHRIPVVDLRAFGEFMSTIVSAASNVTFHCDYEGTRSTAAAKQEKPKGREKGFLNTHADDSDGVKAQGEQKRDVNAVEKGPVQPKPCPVCQKNGHKVKECYKFQKSSIDERWKLVQQLHLCRRCLTSHGKWPCKAPVCGQNGCELKHHSLLHSEKVGTPATNESSSQSTAKVNVHRQGSRSTLFRIVPVRLYSKDSSIDILAFLDDGSSFTLMEQGVADQLGIDGVIEPLCLQWTNNVTRTESESKVVQLEISGISSDKRYTMERVRTVESLGLPPQSLRFEQMEQQFPYLRGLPVNSYSGAVPRILIGLDNTDLMVTLKKRIGKPLEPVATKTKLGWTVYGNVEGLDDPPEHRLLHVCSGSTDRELHDLVEEFFTVESTGVKVAPVVEADDDRRAREIMEKTTVRTPSGRFETGLLWRYDCIEFPDSRPMAERRLKCLERKLTADPELYNKVKLHIADLEAKGYIHKATPDELAGFDPRRTWFLPLGLVINPNKPGKIRMVWDAAAKVEGVSFNSMLLKGPDLLTSLKSVLHRFRQRQVAVVGDVREMFFQLFIRVWDRQSQCFVWHDGPSLPVEVYVIDVATFGSTCSPCSAQYVKNRNAEEYRKEFPEAVKAIINNHYVDDYLDSRDTDEEAIRIASEVKQVHAKAGFELRNWLSNSEEVVRRVGESSASDCKSFATDKSTGIERVLGMRWQPTTDEFTFKLCLREDVAQLLSGDAVPTKREVLRVVMSVFDPLGLVAAYVVHGKCLVQDIWRSKTGWDQRIPEEIYSRWRQWVQAIKRLDQETVPRCYFPGYSSAGLDNIELHVFVDASLVAFSCVAYFRIVDQGQVRCALVSAKSKVAPLKPLSIPRLELQAAVLGSRLMKSIQESHTLPIRRRIIWSDSSTVLSWIQSDQRRYRQFVAVRVGEILSETSIDEWRKVPGKLNVADEATKWGEGPCFKNGSRWFVGPEFLYKAESEWPGNELPEPNIPEELRSVHAHHREISEPLIDYKRFSKWERLQRTTAYMIRFCANCFGKVREEATEAGEGLSQEELQCAEETLFRWIQMESYPDEMVAVEEQQERFPDQASRVGRTSPLRKLSPMLDETGVLRIDGRIGAAHYASYAARFPVILPKNHYVTDLILNWYHRQYGHGNNETVVNEVRQRFHVSNLRNAVRKVVKACKWCAVRKATPQPPRMASLPECRLAAYIRPFTFVGVDYCGPFLIRIGRASAKRWVVLFVCQTVRAIHLEIAHSLSTESCKMAMRRFIARRGAPQEIYSDQGTNFLGASNDLKREIAKINSSLANTFTNRNTSWRFNPPSAPHMGGSWERLVRSVKVGLSTLCTSRNPDEESFATIMVEVEAMVNSRPLTYVPVSAEHEEALTPNHFLMLSSSGVVQPAKQPVDVATSLRTNWGHVQACLDRFWTRWIREYLPTLSRRTKWFNEVKPVQAGDLVIVMDEAIRNSWIRGRVLKTHPGKDGRIRSVDVQTGSGVFRRPVAKLAVLDVAHGGIADGSLQQYGSGDVRDSPHLASTHLAPSIRNVHHGIPITDNFDVDANLQTGQRAQVDNDC